MKSILKALAFVLLSAGVASAAPSTTLPPPSPAAIVAPPTTSAAPAAQPQAHELTQADLESFLDGMVPYAIDRADIAGATISVVKDGKLLFAKGYGFANVKKRTPVLPDQTLFRPGSISKLFTWTAVMQLAE